jgi:hypothetical protein
LAGPSGDFPFGLLQRFVQSFRWERQEYGFHLLLSKQRLPYSFQPKQASASPRKIFPREWLLNAMMQQK